MGGKIIELVPGKKEHRCKGLPGLFRRVFSGIGAGSKWQCNDCKTIWVFEINWVVEWSGWLDTGKVDQSDGMAYTDLNKPIRLSPADWEQLNEALEGEQK